MSDRLRYIVVILIVVCFIFLNQRFFKLGRDTAVIISIVIALIVYPILVLFFKRKHKS